MPQQTVITMILSAKKQTATAIENRQHPKNVTRPIPNLHPR